MKIPVGLIKNYTAVKTAPLYLRPPPPPPAPACSDVLTHLYFKSTTPYTHAALGAWALALALGLAGFTEAERAEARGRVITRGVQ